MLVRRGPRGCLKWKIGEMCGLAIPDALQRHVHVHVHVHTHAHTRTRAHTTHTPHAYGQCPHPAALLQPHNRHPTWSVASAEPVALLERSGRKGRPSPLPDLAAEAAARRCTCPGTSTAAAFSVCVTESSAHEQAPKRLVYGPNTPATHP